MKNYSVRMSGSVLQFRDGRKVKSEITREKDGWACYIPVTRSSGVGATYGTCAEAVRRTLEYLDGLAWDGIATYDGGDADAVKYCEMLEKVVA